MYYVDVGDYISIKAYLREREREREREKIRRHKIKTQLNDEKKK